MGLAIESYAGIDVTDSLRVLNLSWTVDERELLQPDLDAAIGAAGARFADDLNWYPVDDPYGDGLLRSVLCQRLKLEERAIAISCGAGVGGLLHSLAASLSGRTVAVLSDTYPDFPEWLVRFGGAARRVNTVPPEADAIFLERPSFLGNAPSDCIEGLNDLCSRAGDRPIYVDESNATYLKWSESAAGLITKHKSLTVLRGLSKGYGMGALRLGIALSQPARAELLRHWLPAVQVASPALRLGQALLSLPAEALARLHAGISDAKTITVAALVSAEIPPPTLAHAALPYFLYDEDTDRSHGEAVSRLAALGVHGKRHTVWRGRPTTLRRYSVPLSPHRLARLLDLLSIDGKRIESVPQAPAPR